MEKTYENILCALKYYIPIRHWNLNNWDIIIKREEEVEKNVFKYKCSFFTLYFNEKVEPITYGHQYIIGEKVYYDTTEGRTTALAYYFLGWVSWSEKKGWGL